MPGPISRRDFLRTLSCAAAGCSLAGLTGCSSSKSPPFGDGGLPNIIIVFTDDQGYADLGCFGARDFETPRLDRMADEGIQFTQFYSAASVCTPSRAALLTGCYPLRVGLPDVLFPEGPSWTEGKTNIGIHEQELTIAELLKKLDYRTAAVGKWHLGHRMPFLPTRHGFDTYFGLPYSNDMTPDLYPDLPLMDGEEVIETNPDQSQLTARYTQKALEFIESNADRRFFLYLAHSMPHIPLAVSDGFRGRSAQGLYGDVMMEIDWSVGRIFDKLAELGIDENTLVVFASDNGPWLVYGNHAGSASPLREGKATSFEGGHRVPCLMRWPARIPRGETCQEMVTTMDILPSIAALTGGALPSLPIDGKNVLPLIEGRAGATSPHEAVYFYNSHQLQAVRSGEWKLHFAHAYKTVIQPGQDGAYGVEESRELGLSLFHLERDPQERDDLAGQYPEVVERLTALASAFDAELRASMRDCGRV
ncbi:MAG: sulfatase [Deltaproteobacteria bacterium]|nr:sulfatase [Deltaproteobacteria bacterium]